MTERNGRPDVPVLFVSDEREDYEYLKQLFADRRWGRYTGARWTLHSSTSVAAALSVLEKSQIPIILSECDLGSDTWREMLGALTQFPEPPLLIVVSRLDDDGLWSEALNVGAYDVVAKPFAAAEVMRIVHTAWLDWKDLHGAAPAAADQPRYRTAIGF